MNKFQSYLMTKFPEGNITGKSQWNYICPSCANPKSKAYTSLDTGATHCFHCLFSCQNWWDLIAYLQGLPNRASAERWWDKQPEFTVYHYNQVVPNGMQKTWMERKLPTEFRLLDKPEGPFWDYLKRRKLDNWGLIQDLKIGYCSSGKYEGRLIFPVYDENDVLEFFVDRSIDPDCPKQWKTLGVGTKSESWAVPKANVIFNYGRLKKKGRNPLEGIRFDEHCIFIAEGIGSALSLHEYGLALLGKQFNDVQLYKIAGLSQPIVYIALDPDAWSQQIKLADALFSMGKDVFTLNLENDMDPNDYLMAGLAFPEPKKFDKKEQLKWTMKGVLKRRYED